MRIIIPEKQQLPTKSDFRLGQELPKMKPEVIRGLVTSIVDGNTFEISVHEESNIHNTPRRIEKIRIHGMDKPSTSTLSGILAKLELEKKIIGHTLECEILRTNSDNQLVAVIPEKYFNSNFSFSVKNQT